MVFRNPPAVRGGPANAFALSRGRNQGLEKFKDLLRSQSLVEGAEHRSAQRGFCSDASLLPREQCDAKRLD